MGGNEATRPPEAVLALLAASELGDRSKSAVQTLPGAIAEIAEITDDAEGRGTLSQYACSCHGCRTCHGCREAGPS